MASSDDSSSSENVTGTGLGGVHNPFVSRGETELQQPLGDLRSEKRLDERRDHEDDGETDEHPERVP